MNEYKNVDSLQTIREKTVEEIKEAIEKMNDKSMKLYRENLDKDNDLSNDASLAIAVRNEIIQSLKSPLT